MADEVLQQVPAELRVSAGHADDARGRASALFFLSTQHVITQGAWSGERVGEKKKWRGEDSEERKMF